VTQRPSSEPLSDSAALAAGLQRLRSFKQRPERDVTIASLVETESRRLRQTQRATTRAAGAWDTLLASAQLPAGLASRVSVVSFRAGVLTLRATDASSKYALERYLRAGGEAALARLSSTPLRRVKVTL
jgi:hypothetical protein